MYVTDHTRVCMCVRVPCDGMYLYFGCRFEQVPLVTPNGDVLVQELNFEVHR